MEDVTKEAICDILKVKRNSCLDDRGSIYEADRELVRLIDKLLEIFD